MRAQEFYLENGPMNGAGAASPVLRDLPRGIGALCEIVQGVLIHRDIVPSLYGIKLSDEERDLANIRNPSLQKNQLEDRESRHAPIIDCVDANPPAMLETWK